MKNRSFFIAFILLLLVSCTSEKREIIEDNFNFAAEQLAFAMSETDKAIREESTEKRRKERNGGKVI